MRSITTQELMMISGGNGEENNADLGVSVDAEVTTPTTASSNLPQTIASMYIGASSVTAAALYFSGNSVKDSFATAFLLAPMTMLAGAVIGLSVYKHTQN